MEEVLPDFWTKSSNKEYTYGIHTCNIIAVRACRQLIPFLAALAEWKTSKSEMLKFSGRLWTTSPSWYQNSFWNHDQTILLLRNWANVNYVTQKIRNIMKHIKVRNLELFGQIINHVTLLISEQLSESSSDHLSFAKLSKRELQNKVPPAQNVHFCVHA